MKLHDYLSSPLDLEKHNERLRSGQSLTCYKEDKSIGATEIKMQNN